MSMYGLNSSDWKKYPMTQFIRSSLGITCHRNMENGEMNKNVLAKCDL